MMDRDCDYSGHKVLVTGAGGFIGSHLCEALTAAGAGVRALVRYNGRNDWGHLERIPEATREAIEVVLGDVRDGAQIRRTAADCSVIFHLAALIGIPYSYVAPESYLDTNVRGALNVLEAARTTGARVILTSTSEVYGTARYTPMDEGHPLQAQSPYSASKIASDVLGESFHRSFDLPVVILRPFNTFGPRQSSRAVIPTIASQLLGGARELHLGSRHPIRDFTFVSDIVRGFLLAGRIEGATGQVINLGSGKGVTVGDLADRLMELAGRKIPIEAEESRVRPERSEVLELVAGTGRAREILGWAHRVPLEEGLREVLAHVSRHLSDYKPTRYTI